jgi:hypothetical protein
MTKDGLVFDQLSDTVLEVRDTISNQQYRIESSEPMEVEPTDYDDFPGPVTNAIVIDAVDITLHGTTGPTVRSKDGRMKTRIGVTEGAYTSNADCVFLELHTSVKSYLRLDGSFEFKNTRDEGTFELSDSTRVILGSRAWKCHPNDTITVSESISDLRKAISHFGDSILDTSPERSFPTLRGHPPRLQVGDSLDIPDSISKPDSGITITVPPTVSALFTVAPLAYYLLATVESGPVFKIETETGFTYEPKNKSLQEAVQSVLTRCFHLDCITRTEGLYQIDLQERHDFEKRSEIELDFAELYEQSLANRTETYLQVDPKVIETITTEWTMTAVVEPDLREIEALPYLVYELAHICPENPPRYTGDEARKHALDAFSDSIQESRSTTLVFENEAEFVDVPETGSHQTTWVGEGIPLNAAKFLLEGYEHDTLITDAATSADETGTSSSDVEVTVVCNEEVMARESTKIRNIFEPRDDFPMDLSVHTQLSTNKFRQVLEKGTDYLHFVGHATPEGLECSDGMMDVTTVEESNVRTFFLNACQSYQQGKQLVKQGSSGGIVTYSDISNRYALETSSLILQLLSSGLAIGSCLSLVQDTTPIGGQYTIVGSHNAKVIQSAKVVPHFRYVSKGEDGYQLRLIANGGDAPNYTTGAVINYELEPITRYRTFPSSTTVDVEWNQLKDFLLIDDIPVVYEGELRSRDDFFETIEQQRSSGTDSSK